jgi:hypothetical protein
MWGNNGTGAPISSETSRQLVSLPLQLGIGGPLNAELESFDFMVDTTSRRYVS